MTKSFNFKLVLIVYGSTTTNGSIDVIVSKPVIRTLTTDIVIPSVVYFISSISISKIPSSSKKYSRRRIFTLDVVVMLLLLLLLLLVVLMDDDKKFLVTKT